ncbi:hypothetical protein WME89_30965 [Sorangium sp. So ce321]|uniref:hypothetical protein n=1 Tax=Sorangium sp. So ce321 TaxID=3133300 RepID=UPI003F62D0CA
MPAPSPVLVREQTSLAPVRRPIELEAAAVRGGPEPCYSFPMSTEELLAQVLLLPRHERARLAEEVLSSLEEPDAEEVAAA